MNQKLLIGVGLVALGAYLYNKKKTTERAEVVNSAEHSNCSGCSNASGNGNYTPCADGNLSPQECQSRCKGVYNATINECQSGYQAPRAVKARTRSWGNATGWDSTVVG